MSISPFQIEGNIKALVNAFNPSSFIFDFLTAFGEPKAAIERLRTGKNNQLDAKGEVLHRKKLLFVLTDGDIESVFASCCDAINQDQKKTKPRFVMVVNDKQLMAYDSKLSESLNIAIDELAQKFDFFLPLAGIERTTYLAENPADVKAAEKLAKLYQAILKDNPADGEADIHARNVFLSRLLFCYFAEDTQIFKTGIFSQTLRQYTLADGSDTAEFLARLFKVLDTADDQRKDLPDYLNQFPYVNGGLFAEKLEPPKFGTKTRHILLEIGELNWAEIHPDIFGSMMQAVVSPEDRHNAGMHYTSVPNIMKVIKPLFLDELYEQFEAIKTYGGHAQSHIQEKVSKLNALIERMSKIKIFDPACGSGNFLIIAYKELRLLEIEIYKYINLLKQSGTQSSLNLGDKCLSQIKLSQFYGIEIDDFAHETAMLSLWLAEHQMNLKFLGEFGQCHPSLPLKNSGHIVHANALRIEWESVCPKTQDDEIYILGNPPYLGFSQQSKEQKSDKEFVFKNLKNMKKLDLIAPWFYIASQFIKNKNAKFAFVTTNSICQGEQVSLLWTPILAGNHLEIFFAYPKFKWSNNATGKAQVIVAIIGVRNTNTATKWIYENEHKKAVKNINPYLVQAPTLLVLKRSTPISNIPFMCLGNMPVDGGNLLLSENEKEQILKEIPETIKIIRKYVGANEYIQGTIRYCLWLTLAEFNHYKNFALLSKRFNDTKNHRINTKKTSDNRLAKTPFAFGEIRHKDTASLLIPGTSSERRDYIPIGFLNSETIISNLAHVIYDPETYIFGVITSRMHMVWMRAVAGRLEERYRYSSTLVYNTFPFPKITQAQQEHIESLVFDILDARDAHVGKTLAQLYDPDKMPDDLRQAHHAMDEAIERCYRDRPFESDEERLAYLFKMYEKMTND